MDAQHLLLQKRDGILYITIDREDKLNALNASTIRQLYAAIQIAYDDEEVRAVIITGRGQKAFVAGADISEIAQLNQLKARKFAEWGQETFAKIENCPKPVLAAVNGYALGGGCELAMACHIRVATENARFGLPEVSLGIIPGYGGTQRLPRLVGMGRAMEMILTGDMISAQQAHAWGLVNHVVAGEELMDKCEEIIGKIASKSPVALTQAIESMLASSFGKEGYAAEAAAFAHCCKTEDFKEGTAAFLEKRKPAFKGK